MCSLVMCSLVGPKTARLKLGTVHGDGDNEIQEAEGRSCVCQLEKKGYGHKACSSIMHHMYK